MGRWGNDWSMDSRFSSQDLNNNNDDEGKAVISLFQLTHQTSRRTSSVYMYRCYRYFKSSQATHPASSSRISYEPTTMILSVVPKKMKKVAVVSLLALSGVAMLSNSISDFGINLSSDTSLGHLRRLTAEMWMGFAPGIVNTAHKLAAPFLEDQANIFVFDETDTRPVMNTFFAIQEGKTIRDVDATMLAVWKQAWSGAGWNPRILNIGHAEAHPEYADIIAKLDNDVPLGNNVFYDKSCFLRHFAMAALGGGWMSDYDTVPLNIDAEIDGRNFPNDGKFTTFEGNVPSLIVGSGEEWERVSKALLQKGVDAGANKDVGYKPEGKRRLFSDMFALDELVQKGEVIVHEPLSVFQAHGAAVMASKLVSSGDIETVASNLLSHQYCENTQHMKALHFSHDATIAIGYPHDYRPILTAAFLDRWSKLCNGPSFHFDDGAGTESLPVAEIGGPDSNAIAHTNAGADIWVINQPKSGTGFLVSTVEEAKMCQNHHKELEVNDDIRSYECEEDGTRIIRTHIPSEASKLRLHETAQSGEKECFVVSGIRDPQLSIPSLFFEYNKDRFCNGGQTKEEIIVEYEDWLRNSDKPRQQMHTTSELTKAFGITDFPRALDEMNESGFALFKGPADSTSPWNGCDLLLVQLDFQESNENIAEGLSTLLNVDVVPSEHLSRTDLCPDAASNYKALKEYELTDDLINILSNDNPELRQGVNYYRRHSMEGMQSNIASLRGSVSIDAMEKSMA